MEKEEKKVKVKIIINDYIIENIGILVNDTLKVKDDDTNILFNYGNLTLTRKNEEKEIILDFKNNILTYQITGIPNKFSNNLTILSLTNNDKQVIINYQIEENKFYLSINIETI